MFSTRRVVAHSVPGKPGYAVPRPLKYERPDLAARPSLKSAHLIAQATFAAL
jgi:hypothetical protein